MHVQYSPLSINKYVYHSKEVFPIYCTEPIYLMDLYPYLLHKICCLRNSEPTQKIDKAYLKERYFGPDNICKLENYENCFV